MKLSEAIREGAKLREQGHGKYFTFNEAGDDFASCALGAAYEGSGGRIPNLDVQFYLSQSLRRDFPILCRFVSCPACDSVNYDSDIDTLTTIAHLNDEHDWTREGIADWIATIEE